MQPVVLFDCELSYVLVSVGAGSDTALQRCALNAMRVLLTPIARNTRSFGNRKRWLMVEN
jgi:hypothetical protein